MFMQGGVKVIIAYFFNSFYNYMNKNNCFAVIISSHKIIRTI